MESLLPSPAVSIVGRHNSGKTTLVEKLIAELTARGLDVGSIKHHSHCGFDIDIPGKDSYRHRAAGASETMIAAPDQVAMIRSVSHEVECAELVRRMPGHDIVVVEGYRKSGLLSIEVMRAGNQADEAAAQVFLQDAQDGVPLTADFVQQGRAHQNSAASAPIEVDASDDVKHKMPSAYTIAVVTDIEQARQAADIYGIPAFGLDDISAIADFLQTRIARPRLSVVIQAGGESKRMGRSKATVPFRGRPLIQHMVSRVLPVADELIITTNEPENLAFLHNEFPRADIHLVTDALDYRGALPGLFTALQAATNSFVAVVACDMVFASANLIAAECAEMNAGEVDIVVPVNKHGYEPFHAIYRRDTCLEAVRHLTAQGETRIQAFFPDMRLVEFPQSRVFDAEPSGGCFINVNTPEELASVEENYPAN